MQKKNNSIKFFVAVFLAMAALIIYQNLSGSRMVTLQVQNNKGTSFLETGDNSLICVFQDGKVCRWDWNNLSAPGIQFDGASERAIILSPQQLAAVSLAGKKMLTVYSLISGEKQKEFTVGWEDQEVWPRISFNKKAAALIRKNPVDPSGQALYEFLTMDTGKEILGQPVSLSIPEKGESLVDFAITSDHVLCIVGARDKTGRVAAIDLKAGSILWDRVLENTEGFCSVIASPGDQYFLAGNDNGKLYKLDPSTGDIKKEIILLEPGEIRQITNDYSVLNPAFSPDGRYYVVTINPPAYILQADSDTIVQKFSPADKLVSKIAFSPDNQQVATSDIRASYPIKIWKLRGTGQ